MQGDKPADFNRKTFFTLYREKYGKLKQSQVKGLNHLLNFFLLDDEILDIQYIAYMLATVKHECADTYQPIIERGPRSYFLKYEPSTSIGRRLGNTDKGDGYLFRGRGYVQITGRANYRRMTEKLKLNFTENDLILYPESALKPNIAYKIMSYGMLHGSFTGKALYQYINDHDCDYKNARKTINGLDRAELIADYAMNFESILLKGSK